MHLARIRCAHIGLLLLMLLACYVSLHAQQPETGQKSLPMPLRIEGVVQNNGGGWPFSKAGLFIIKLERFSTPEEILSLRLAIAEKGQKGLADALKKMPVLGRLPGVPIALAKCIEKENGQKVLLLIAPERMCMADIHETEHILGAVQITLDEKNKGTGVVAGSVKIDISPEGALSIEAVGQPALLLKDMVASEGKK